MSLEPLRGADRGQPFMSIPIRGPVAVGSGRSRMSLSAFRPYETRHGSDKSAFDALGRV
jgi:hypothetical protein